MEELAKHGTMIPPDMVGLTDEQIEELKLVDTWGETCVPSGGYVENKDPIGRRNGKQPNEKMQGIIGRTVSEVKAAISKVSCNHKVSEHLKLNCCRCSFRNRLKRTSA